MYIYPENLKAKATLWFWSLTDLLILGILFALSLICLSAIRVVYPLMLSVLFAILTIRVEDCSIMDFITAAIRFFMAQQRYFLEVKKNGAKRANQKSAASKAKGKCTGADWNPGNPALWHFTKRAGGGNRYLSVRSR